MLGASVQYKNIHDAAANGDEAAVRGFVVKSKADLGISNKDGQTPVFIAAMYGHVGVRESLSGIRCHSRYT